LERLQNAATNFTAAPSDYCTTTDKAAAFALLVEKAQTARQEDEAAQAVARGKTIAFNKAQTAAG
jgi:hypothetical protein